MNEERRGRLAALALAMALFMGITTIGHVIGFGDANAQEAATAPQNTQEKARESVPSQDGRAHAPGDVRVAIKVYNQDGGTLIEGGKRVPANSNAFDILREMINVESRTFANLGVFVTGLAGVRPPEGHFWILYVDGKPSELGISNITITADTRIEWKIEPPKPH
jgi:hypothetical protein